MLHARVRRIGVGEGLAVVFLLALGWTVRWWHLGTTSLWWDELVHVAFASAPDPWGVFRNVQLGIPPGSGNAGSMPFDYLLLHAWTWMIQRPPLDQIEVYYRFPSYVWSCATLVALWLYARSAFGRVVAIVATAMLAVSIPHVLYTAEARFYSLLMLTSVLNLAAFTWVLRRPDLPRAWVTYGLVNVAFFLTGMLSLLVLPWQYLALLVLAARGAGATGGRPRRLGLLLLTLLLLAAVLAYYYAAVDLDARGIRPGSALLQPGRLTQRAFAFMALDDPRQMALYAAALVLAPLALWRQRHPLLPVALAIVAAEVATVPLLVKLVQWKQYYFHVRHALFLLPGIELLAAIALCGVLRWVVALVPSPAVRPRASWIVVAVALCAVGWLRVPFLRDYLATPHNYFVRSKTLRDFRSIARDLAGRTRFYAPGEKYLLLVDTIGPGYLGNPTLARYLAWYGLEGRVVLLGTADFQSLPARVQRDCDGPCRGRPGEEVAKRLRLLPPFEASPMKRQLLGVGSSFGSWPGTARDIGILWYPESRRWPDLATSTRWPYTGAFLAEPQ
jgi:hypothetical protein